MKVVCAWQYIKRKIYQDSRRIVKTKTFEIIRSGKIRVRQKRFRIFLEKVERAAYKKLDMFPEIEKRRADVSQHFVEMLNINETTENPPRRCERVLRPLSELKARKIIARLRWLPQHNAFTLRGRSHE